MSILINGMKMPTSCDMCWALDDYGDYPRCRITEEQRGYNFPIREKRMDNCPLVPVPPHGDLIDAGEFFKDINESVLLTQGFKETFNLFFDEQLTIIEAEEDST